MYVTSSAAALIPVSAKYARDVALTAEREPTLEGVSRVRLMLEVGFIISRLEELGRRGDARRLSEAAEDFLKVSRPSRDGARASAAEIELSDLAESGWRVHLTQSRVRTE